jgi:hypothetical protein
MSELRPQHNSAYGLGTDRNLPQPNQREVNTETHLSNKVSLQKTSKREMSQRMKAEICNVKSKCYQKIKLHKYGMVVARLYIKYQ